MGTERRVVSWLRFAELIRLLEVISTCQPLAFRDVSISGPPLRRMVQRAFLFHQDPP
jgi:hypothetical protein